MITFKRQGATFIGAFPLSDGRKAQAVIIDGRKNSKGAVLVVSKGPGDQPEAAPVDQSLALLTAEQVIDIVCMQERAFGDSGLGRPE